MKFRIFIILLFLQNFLFAQRIEFKRDLKLIKNPEDTVLFRKLMEKGDISSLSRLDSAIYYYQKAEEVARRCNCPERIAYALNAQAATYLDLSNYKKALILLDSARKFTQDSGLIVSIDNNKATIFSDVGLYDKSLKIYLRNLEYLKKRDFKFAISVTYFNIAAIYNFFKLYDSAIFYTRKALILDKSQKDTFNSVFDYYNLGFYYLNKNVLDSAKLYLDTALVLASLMQMKFILSDIYYSLAQMSAKKGDFKASLLYYRKALNYAYQIKDFRRVFINYNGLFTQYLNADSLQKAKCCLDSMKFILSRHNDFILPADTIDFYNVNYLFYKKTGKTDLALYFLEKKFAFKDSLDENKTVTQALLLSYEARQSKFKQELHKYESIAQSNREKLKFIALLLFALIIIGLIFAYFFVRIFRMKSQLQQMLEKDRIQLALYNIQKLASSLLEEKPLNDFIRHIISEILNSECFKLQKKAIIMLKDKNDVLNFAVGINMDEYKDHYKGITKDKCYCKKVFDTGKPLLMPFSEIRKFSEDFYPATHLILPLKIENKIFGVVNFFLYENQGVTEREREFFEQLSILLSLIVDRKIQRDKQKENLKIQNELNQKLFAQSLMLEKKNLDLQKANQKIQEQAKQLENILNNLHSSINYASYILRVLLPTESQLKKNLGEYFLLFKPLEAIGGDFYYLNVLDENKLILAVGDATGHGIPGALLALQTINYLREIISLRNIRSPKNILTELRFYIKKLFESATEESIKASGVDMAVILLDKQNKSLVFAGANLPIIIVRNKEVIRFKGTKAPVGNYIIEREFSEENFFLKENDMIYLQSDGFRDQLGGENFSKFSAKRYEQLLAEISDLSMEEQKEILLKTITDWIKNSVQIDDITVLGFRIKY